MNGERTGTLENLSAEEAYTEAVPGEALFPFPNNRWHVMMRYSAIERMKKLDMQEELAIAWQDSAPRGYDTERIIIVRTDAGRMV